MAPLFLATILAVVASGEGSSQQVGSLRSAVNAKIEADGSLIWSAGRPLVRGDFIGPVPDSVGQFAAVTASGILHAIACDRAHVEYVIYALFSPTGSWTLPDALLDTPAGARPLAHEPGHFDLTEIAARQLRAQLKQFNVPCDSATAAFGALAEAADVRLLELQTRYDDETTHAMVPAEQARWLAWIRATLDSIPAGEPWTSRKYWKQ